MIRTKRGDHYSEHLHTRETLHRQFMYQYGLACRIADTWTVEVTVDAPNELVHLFEIRFIFSPSQPWNEDYNLLW